MKSWHPTPQGRRGHREQRWQCLLAEIPSRLDCSPSPHGCSALLAKPTSRGNSAAFMISKSSPRKSSPLTSSQNDRTSPHPAPCFLMERYSWNASASARRSLLALANFIRALQTAWSARRPWEQQAFDSLRSLFTVFERRGEEWFAGHDCRNSERVRDATQDSSQNQNLAESQIQRKRRL